MNTLQDTVTLAAGTNISIHSVGNTLTISATTVAIVTGSGGTSTGGAYAVSGTIGQPGAGGPITGGPYSVTGAFWALPIAVQSDGSPILTIVPDAPGQARISWTPNTPGFVLREALTISPTHWVSSPSGSTNPVVVPATLPAKFYRLEKP